MCTWYLSFLSGFEPRQRATHSARQSSEVQQQAGDHTGTLRHNREIQRESSQTTLQSICEHNRAERRTGRPASTGRHAPGGRAHDHKVELDEETEARRVRAGTLQVITDEIEVDEEKEAGGENVGTLQTIAHKFEPNEEKNARRTGRHTPGGLGTGPN